MAPSQSAERRTRDTVSVDDKEKALATIRYTATYVYVPVPQSKTTQMCPLNPRRRDREPQKIAWLWKENYNIISDERRRRTRVPVGKQK